MWPEKPIFDITYPVTTVGRYQAVVKALNTSNETVLALGACFSVSADSHLVTLQQEDGAYQTQAINICNKVSQSFYILSFQLNSYTQISKLLD